MPQDKPLITIPNFHVDPFEMDYSLYSFVAYFENQYGEQLLYTVKRDEFIGVLYHGDNGWHPEDVIDGQCHNIVLDRNEANWVRACWEATAYIRQKTISGKTE